MGSPFLQKLQKSPLAPKVPIFRSLTVGSKLAGASGKVYNLNSDVSKKNSLPVGKEAVAGSPPLTAIKKALSPFRFCSTNFPSSGGRQKFPGHHLNYYSPNFGNNDFLKCPREDVTVYPDSPAVALQFSATHSCEALIQSPCRIAKYTNERRKLYHQDSPPGVVCRGSLASCSSDVQSPAKFTDDQDPDNEVFELRKSSVGSAVTTETPKSTPKLGKGGFGTVFSGKYDGKLVAIKQLYNRKKNKDRSQEESLCAELNAFRLDHPNVVRILAFTSLGISEQVVFEYVGPKNLQQILDDIEGEKMNVDRRYRYSCELAEALRYCHSRRILHLDVKAANIMLTEEGDHCKLADFGCSRVLQIGADHVTLTPSLSSNAGTLIFKAPELLKGLPASDKADVYSFAFVVWQCLSRKLPFEGYHPHTIVFCVVSKGLRPDCCDLNLEHLYDRLLFQLAQNSWQDDPEQRPSFIQICETLRSGVYRDIIYGT